VHPILVEWVLPLGDLRLQNARHPRVHYFGLKDAAAAEPNRAARVSGDSLSRVGCCNLRLHFRDQGNVRGFEAYCLCLDGIPRMGRGQGTIGTDMIKNIQPNVGEHLAQNGDYSTAARA